MVGDYRGVLYPARLPTFHRLPAPASIDALVRWFWVPEWDLEPGRVSRQQLIAFPASNLIVEAGSVGVSGPTTVRSWRDLHGRGWAVGALLHPAAVPHLIADPAALRDSYATVDYPELLTSVASAMTADVSGDKRRSDAVDVLADWLSENLPPPDEDGLLANAMVELIDGDATVLRVGDAAERLGVSVRTLQRLAQRHVGLPPAALIRRRRLQEAAQRLRTEPGIDIAAVAADLGYTDHAHLTGDFRAVLGFTPSAYRQVAEHT